MLKRKQWDKKAIYVKELVCFAVFNCSTFKWIAL